MDRPYKELRRAMRSADVSNVYLAEKLDMAASSVSLRLNGHCPWESDRMYAVMDLLHLPYDQLHIYFPPGGVANYAKRPEPDSDDTEVVEAIKTLVRHIKAAT